MQQNGSHVKERLKHLAARLMRPGLLQIDHLVRKNDARMDRVEQLLEVVASSSLWRDKYREELAFWRQTIKHGGSERAYGGPFAEVFYGWQRDRLRELARWLGLEGSGEGEEFGRLDAALDAWCAERSAVEIGGGPFPALAAAPRWRRAVAVDPLARSYAEEELMPPHAAHVVPLDAPGERIPLPAGFADLVITENCLDHVTDPAKVLSEVYRLLRPGGLLWLLVDLSNYSDHMHPHPFNEERVKRLLSDGGFETVREHVSDHKSHPKAYGEYRGLLRRPEGGEGWTANDRR